jgi:hypothetical protein
MGHYMNGVTMVETSAELQLVDPAKIAIEWSFLLEQLTLAPDLWDTFYTVEDIRTGLEENRFQLWIARDTKQRLFWGLSEVWTRRDGRNVLVVWWAQGVKLLANMPVVLELLSRVARSMNFAAVTVRGRKGWERALAPHGFKFLRVEVTRELET